VASIESVLWGEAATHFAKAAIGRERPVMYTDLAPDVADLRSNRRSMPSGHTSTAFALATSYWLSRKHLLKDDKPWLRWVFMGAAVGVGVFRVAGSNHHPTDVLIGAGVGVGTAVLVHHIKF
jgi:membrane-associated phospholipid phosphatase